MPVDLRSWADGRSCYTLLEPPPASLRTWADDAVVPATEGGKEENAR